MAEWKKFTGSNEQLNEIKDSANGWIYRLHDGTESFVNRGEVHDSYSLQHITEYMICDPHPHAGMIQRWAATGQPVYIRPKDCDIWILYGKPSWHPEWEYSFNPPQERIYLG